MAELENAYEYPATELKALQRADGPRATRRFGRLLLLLLLVTPFVLAFAPWQQNLAGEGRVIEYDPVQRPMPIQARTDGLLMKWHVQEGQYVKVGDPIVDLADNDPQILERLQEELDAALEKREAALRKRQQFELQVATAESARQESMQLADDEIASAEQSLVVAEQAVLVAEQKVELAQIALLMWEGLVKDKIGAGFNLQKARQEHSVAMAELAAKQAAVVGATANLRAKKSARRRVEQSELLKVQEARAKADAAAGDVATADGSIPKLRRDLQRQRQQKLTAPVDGFIQNLIMSGQGGGFVKQGTTLATLVPASQQLAVELFVDGNDVTFIDVGRHVRLQFEGWPAIQWVGWPSAAVGTFGGKVAFVDRFDAGSGKFRVMVLPDERPFREPEGAVVDWLRDLLSISKADDGENPHAWPGEEYLRQGVRVRGWVVLDQVSLGFEIWRQLNGFPPTVDRKKAAGAGSGGGK